MKETIIVGDLHGKYELVEKALSTNYDVVFVGDYLDSFDRSVDDQIKTLTMVLDAIECNPERVTGLLGNHEISYMIPGMHCSGWKLATQSMVDHIIARMKVLKPFTWVGEYLVTHAGVSSSLLKDKDIDLIEYLESDKFYDIGYSRGGFSNFGGLYWSDWSFDFNPIEGVNQIFGHSSDRVFSEELDIDGLRVKEGIDSINYNIDNLDRINEVLMVKSNGKDVEVFTL